MKIFINPGHAPNGIPDPGAMNKITGSRECDITSAVGYLLSQYLLKKGYEVEQLQSDDLNEIVNVANKSNPDIFISIHCNAFNTRARGTETLVYSFGGDSENLGQCIQDKLYGALSKIDLSLPNRGLKERGNSLAVLRDTTMPACLVEIAFIDNMDDENLLTNYQDCIAQAIIAGIIEYISLD